MSAEEIARLPYRPCVGLMIINRQNAIFVGNRIDTEVPAWQMPQGGIDVGETPEQAAMRELQEETGLDAQSVEILARSRQSLTYDLPPERVPTIWGGRFRGQKQNWFLLRFIGDEDQIDIDTLEPEFDAWRWLPASELVDCAIAFKRDVYRQVLLEFAPHLDAGQ